MDKQSAEYAAQIAYDRGAQLAVIEFQKQADAIDHPYLLGGGIGAGMGAIGGGIGGYMDGGGQGAALGALGGATVGGLAGATSMGPQLDTYRAGLRGEEQPAFNKALERVNGGITGGIAGGIGGAALGDFIGSSNNLNGGALIGGIAGAGLGALGGQGLGAWSNNLRYQQGQQAGGHKTAAPWSGGGESTRPFGMAHSIASGAVQGGQRLIDVIRGNPQLQSTLMGAGIGAGVGGVGGAIAAGEGNRGKGALGGGAAGALAGGGIGALLGRPGPMGQLGAGSSAIPLGGSPGGGPPLGGGPGSAGALPTPPSQLPPGRDYPGMSPDAIAASQRAQSVLHNALNGQ